MSATVKDIVTDKEALKIAIAALNEKIMSYAIAERTEGFMGDNTPPVVKRDVRRLKVLRSAAAQLQRMKAQAD